MTEYRRPRSSRGYLGGNAVARHNLSPSRMYLPQIVHSKISRLKKSRLMQEQVYVKSYSNYIRRPAKDKDRKWQLRGWDMETRPADKNEDGG